MAELKLKEDFISIYNVRDVSLKFYITYIITSIVFLRQLGYSLSILIVILIKFLLNTCVNACTLCSYYNIWGMTDKLLQKIYFLKNGKENM